MKYHVREAVVLQGGQEGGLLEDVVGHHVGSEQEQRGPVVLGVADDVLQ